EVMGLARGEHVPDKHGGLGRRDVIERHAEDGDGWIGRISFWFDGAVHSMLSAIKYVATRPLRDGYAGGQYRSPRRKSSNFKTKNDGDQGQAGPKKGEKVLATMGEIAT